VDFIAAHECGHHLRRPVPQTPVADLNHDAIIGLNGVGGVHNSDAIRPRSLPIRAAADEVAPDERALYRSFPDGNDAARTLRRIADGYRRRETGIQLVNEF
jgi:hypothetical protein